MIARRAFTLIELLIVILIMGMLMSILMPALGKAKDMVRQAKCRAQLRGLGNALQTYATANGDTYPDAGTYPPPSGNRIDTLGSMWLLVTNGNAPVELFVCPSEEIDARTTAWTGATGPTDPPFPNMPDGRMTISYSYQVPHGPWNAGRSCMRTSNFAVMADRNPFDPQPPLVPMVPKPGGRLLSAVPGGSAATTVDAYRKVIANLTVTPYTAANSRACINSINHRGEGQNVLFRDGHVTWCLDPLVGVDNDNIYTSVSTTAANPTLQQKVVGTAPTGTQMPSNANDSCLRTTR